jgi:F-box-like
MAPTFCNRCGDAVEEGCDPRDELADLDALLERLKIKRYDLKRKINRLHSPIVRQLPPEVMSTIFEFCLPDFTGNQLIAFFKEDLSFPTSLGAICSYWRDIAWSTPSLWSSLVVGVTKGHNPHVLAGIVQEWLSRSGQLPLSIRILAYHEKIVSGLTHIINQHSTRWSDLDLYILPPRYKLTDNHDPTLKSVRFHCSDSTMNLNFQLTYPRSERASLEYFSMTQNGFNIQWDNLTHLTLHSMSTIDSFRILRKTTRLVFGKVSSCVRYRRQNIGALVLTSLRSLQLWTTHAEQFLNNIIAPHLEEFSLPHYYNPSMEIITSFLRRSACSLRSFSVMFAISSPYFEGFMSLLRSMPSLNSLSLRSITTTYKTTTPEDYDPQNILKLLAKVLSSQSTSPQGGFLPNLQVLEYIGELYLRPGNYDDLYPLPPADNAEHRHLRLFKLDLYPATRIPKYMISYLSSLVERGVTVNVTSDSEEDILRSSIDYYRFRKDSLRRDWTDNLDSSLFSELSQIVKYKVNTFYLDQPGCNDNNLPSALDSNDSTR